MFHFIDIFVYREKEFLMIFVLLHIYKALRKEIFI